MLDLTRSTEARNRATSASTNKMLEGALYEIADRMALTRRHDVVIRFVPLQH